MAISKWNLSLSMAALFALVALPPLAQAKAPTYKLVIEGGGLTQPLEITDAKLLDLSNVWTGIFVDSSRDPVPEAPCGMGPYEISFYVKFGKDIRKKYVVYYHPRSSSQSGYIYLPGSGDTFQYLNWGTVMRQGDDGKWHYALPAWESLVKPIIAHADPLLRQRLERASARSQPPTTQAH
jgi:hypothetical protein